MRDCEVLTWFGAMNCGECVSNVSRIIDGKTSRKDNNDGRRDLDRQTPKVHETEKVDERESNARKDPEDGHQIRDED